MSTTSEPRPYDSTIDLKVGDYVAVFYRGGIGRADRRVIRKITKLTKTQITLSDGVRFMKSTGDSVGAPSIKWGGGSAITHVYP